MGVATVAVVGASITGAEARIPGVGNGVQPSSDAPNLRSATIIGADLGDSQPEKLRYCFDVNVTPGASTAFFVETYDSTRSMQGGGEVVLDPSDQRCVQVSFANGLDVKQGTIGIVVPGAVSRAGGTVTNFEASEPLGGSISAPVAGRTTAPDLVSVDVNAAASGGAPGGTVKYTFDEDIDPDLPATVGATDPPTSRASLFFFYRDNGDLVAGTNFLGVSTDRRAVTIGFDEAVSGGRVFLANDTAVRDRPQSAAEAGLPLTTSSGIGAITTGTVSRPQLTGAASLGAKQFQLSYSGTVFPNGTAARIFAVTDDGRTFPGTADSTGPNGSIVTTFGTLDDTEGVVRIVDRGDGARTGDDVASAVSQVAVGAANMAPGFTSAPDLLSASFDPATNAVTYRFDEKVESTGAGFFTFAQSGDKKNATSATFEGSIVRANFDSTSSNTVGAGVNLGGTPARDSAGHRSPPTSVGYATEQPPAPPAPPAPPTSTTPPVIVQPPPAKRAKFRTSFRSFKVKSRTRYSGRITSSGRGCKSGRRIALKRNGRTIRNGFTKGDGTFTLARTKGTRGKRGIYVVVTERSSKSVTCTARSSKKLKRG